MLPGFWHLQKYVKLFTIETMVSCVFYRVKIMGLQCQI